MTTTTTNPLGLDGIEFIELAGPNPDAIARTLRDFGFHPRPMTRFTASPSLRAKRSGSVGWKFRMAMSASRALMRVFAVALLWRKR